MDVVREMVIIIIIIILDVENCVNINDIETNISDCLGKSCQPGEVCQSGLCIKVEGRFCSLAIRDCAEEFECIKNTCHDQLVGESDTVL